MSILIDAVKPQLAMGWKLLPANVYKTPMVKGWRQAATNDIGTISQWENDFHNLQLAAATGSVSNVWVIDVDVKDDRDGLAALEDMFGPIAFDEQYLIAQTPSGGFHFYFQWDSALPVTTHVNVIDGIDIRGEGGLIMLPPSSARKSDGSYGQYQWLDESAKPAPINTWARELALMALKRDTSGNDTHVAQPSIDLNSVLTGLPAGKRNSELWRYTCHLRGKGISAQTALAFMKAAASFCNPPYPEHEVVDMVRRAYELAI